MKYTVRQATATGKVDPTYGAEYLVHFNEDPREVKMSRQNPIAVGQEENGTIVDGKFGAYFKKDPYQGGAPASSGGRSFAPRKDNSDGQRQGMCINNAASYIANAIKEPLPADKWATAVHKYATALYQLGDLTAPVVEEPVIQVEGEDLTEDAEMAKTIDLLGL